MNDTNKSFEESCPILDGLRDLSKECDYFDKYGYKFCDMVFKHNKDLTSEASYLV